MEKADADSPDISVDHEVAALARLLWYAKSEALSLGKIDTAALISTAILALRSDGKAGQSDVAGNAAAGPGTPPSARWTSWISATRRKLP